MNHLSLQYSGAVGWNVENASFYILSLDMLQTHSPPGCKSSCPRRENRAQSRGTKVSGGDVTHSSRNTKGTRLGSLVIHPPPCYQDSLGGLRAGLSLQQMWLKVMAKF